MTGTQTLASPVQPVRIARASPLARLLGRLMALGYRLIGKHRYDNFRLEWVQSAPFIVTPSVFNPKVPRTGEFLAAQLHAGRLDPGCEVLDMGTGSGVCAVLAARHARRVVAVDINPAAIRCADINARLNHLEHRIELRLGDLFAPVSGERFDLVLFNPPFLRGTPRDDRERAWRSEDVAERFAAGLRTHLKPGGSALVLLSTFGAGLVFLEEFRKQQLEVSVLAERWFLNERLTIFKLAPPHSPLLAERHS